MTPSIQSPRVHDLLLTTSTEITQARQAEPAWVGPALQRYPWVVARRAVAPEDLVAVGVRGIERRQRWGGFMRTDQISRVVAPYDLRSELADPNRLNIPALQALRFIETELSTLPYRWGPGGSVGYELVSRIPGVTPESDLDLILSAPERFNRRFGRELMQKIAEVPCKVDVRVETSWCGFSLEEYSRHDAERFLVRTPAGPRLADDPWSYVQESPQ
jgi:phosphoribosyl-dephospho-CoA transferase